MNNFPITVKDSKRSEYNIHVRQLPDHCPQCQNGIEAQFITAFIQDNDYPSISICHVQAIFKCPRRECSKLFIANYVQDNRNQRGYESDKKYTLALLAPISIREEKFPDNVSLISPMFCEIFNESLKAEKYGLLNVAGPGYRKALEFLIKDYLIGENPDREDLIKKMTLQNAVCNKIADANLKLCAERAAWLGNDEAHYLRKWDKKDMQDLKGLIKLSVNWIENNLLTRQITKDMPPKLTRSSKKPGATKE